MVVVCWLSMSTSCMVLVGAGPLPDLLMRRTSEALASHCGADLIGHTVDESPIAVLQTSTSPGSLIQLSGDAARLHATGSSWLDALADWRTPVLLLVEGESGGGVPGTAAAYTALCKALNVPLQGLVQLEGDWDPKARRRDGLPWRGWIPATADPRHEDGLDALADLLRRGRLNLKAMSARAAEPDRV